MLMPLLETIKNEVGKVIVSGISTVTRAVINTKSGGSYNLIVEGTDMRFVMGTLGIKGKETVSNHVMEVEKVLGIEAARTTIIREISTTMDSHGLSVDYRHIALLADIMSYR